MKIENIKVVDILQDGRGVGRTENKTVFIEGAVFGEILDLEVIEEKKNYLEGKKIRTVKESPHYKQPPCPYFYECGGCSIMNIDYETQKELKIKMIKSSLKKTCKIDIKELEILGSQEERYRNKIRLKVTKTGKLAYNKKYSNNLVEIKDCLLVRENISKRLEDIEKVSEEIAKKFPNILEEITIRTNQEKILVNLSIKKESIELENYLEKINENSKLYFQTLGRNKKLDYLDYKVLGKNIRISSNDFYQVNDFQIENLYKEAKKLLKENKKVLDLYCGSATSSIAINGDNIVGVDINRSAIADAKENAKRNNLKNYKFIAKDSKFITENFIKNEKIDAIVVDPPRSGLDKELIKQIANTGLKEVVYISCNPQTLARDIKRFMDKGYELKNIKAIDMFPETMHVEAIALIQKI